jgi:predicted aspartyl protease
VKGVVTENGDPIVTLGIAGRDWTALIDTGFNGDVELPEALRPFVNPVFLLNAEVLLAAGQSVWEDYYQVDFPFDGRNVRAEASFVDGEQLLIGTQLLKAYQLDINFPAQTVGLERIA